MTPSEYSKNVLQIKCVRNSLLQFTAIYQLVCMGYGLVLTKGANITKSKEVI